jgi:hypothetical protein
MREVKINGTTASSYQRWNEHNGYSEKEKD